MTDSVKTLKSVHEKKILQLKQNRIGWEVGERFEREGTYVYLWLITVDVWQKPTQCS